MCRNIRRLANFKPPATEDEIRASALQYVRKISGSTHPSQVNQKRFDRAVEAITKVSTKLIEEWEPKAPPRDREEEAARLKARSAARFAKA